MKTIKIIISIFVLAGFFISCQKDIIQPDQDNSVVLKTTGDPGTQGQYNVPINATYSVTIQLSDLVSYCGTYIVKITNESGKNIAPPQLYVPGQYVYTFSEKTRLINATRIASFVMEQEPIDICSFPLYAIPHIQQLKLENEQVYQFLLQPTTKPPK
jgi:hypothetical protein